MFFFLPLHLDFKETNKIMDKNTIIGFVLIAVVLIGFSWYNQPSAEQIEAQRREDSIAAINITIFFIFLK